MHKFLLLIMLTGCTHSITPKTVSDISDQEAFSFCKVELCSGDSLGFTYCSKGVDLKCLKLLVGSSRFSKMGLTRD
jgi:hypothetical protein